MQHCAERSLGDLVFEDAPAVLVCFAGVDHQRQAGCARRRDMCAKAALLSFTGAVLVEIIQPASPSATTFGCPGQLDQFAGGMPSSSSA
jgi:hypothetical protein